MIPPKRKSGGVPPPPYLFFFTHESFRGKQNRDYKKIESLGAFHPIMNPTVDKRKLKREEEEKNVDEILKEVNEEF